MSESNMWRIGNTYVEKEVYKYAKTQKSEHACHSFIVDVNDKCWEKVFDSDVLKEIKRKNNPKLETLLPELDEYYERFKNKTTVDELWRVAKATQEFDPVVQFDLDWSQRAIVDLVSSYRWGVVSRVAATGLEKDIMVRFWRNLDLCFDNLSIETKRGDQQSTATSARTNEERVGDDGSILPKIRVEKPDLILIKDGYEYGCSEAGSEDNAGVGVKEAFERYIKLPKIMKDMLLRLQSKLDNDKELMPKLKIVGFSHTHLRMTALTMDNPCGYICRVIPLAEQVIPVQPSLFYANMIPLLEVTWKMKKIVQSTLEIVEAGPEKRRSSDYARNQQAAIIPSSLDVRSKPNSRKRRRTESSTTEDQ
ncbi:hypothetical protein BJV82DRAFT_182790 [Fennellomyces sp. T-0311]|nr:hypothetical protein BJV82DRAFT_182790 [Fennellomyces sp. T-0311]